MSDKNESLVLGPLLMSAPPIAPQVLKYGDDKGGKDVYLIGVRLRFTNRLPADKLFMVWEGQDNGKV